METAQLSELMKECGITGAGGAGFPAHMKLCRRVKTIILNCAECEPLFCLHRQLLQSRAYEVLSAFYELGTALGAKRMIVAIRKSFRAAADAVQEYLGLYGEMELKLLEDVYPAGDEVVLIYEATGEIVPPGGLPADVGAAVFNVETVYNLYRAVTYHEPVTDKLVMIGGEIEHPMTIRIPLGMSVREAAAFAGRILVEDPVYLIGGAMMGRPAGADEVVTRTTNAIIVLPQNHPVIMKKRKNTGIDLKRTAAACCQCSMCTDLCPRNLLGHPIDPARFMLAAACKDVRKPDIFIHTMFCSSCGLCEMYSCPQGLSPGTLITEYKNRLQEAGIPLRKETAGPLNPAREYRKVPILRLAARIGLMPYLKKAPLIEGRVKAERVRIPLREESGAFARPAVKAGDFAERGQVIGAPADERSTAVHASISGRILEANDRFVMIEAVRKDVQADE